MKFTSGVPIRGTVVPQFRASILFPATARLKILGAVLKFRTTLTEILGAIPISASAVLHY